MKRRDERHCVPVAFGVRIGNHETDVVMDHNYCLLDFEMLMQQQVEDAAKEASGKPVLFMDVDGKRRIDLGMTDGAPFAKVKVGDTITVTCKIGGADGALMQVTDCTKQ